MMHYQPNHHLYASDKGATSSVKQNQAAQRKSTFSSSSSPSDISSLSTGVSTESFLDAANKCLCGDLTELSKHWASKRPIDPIHHNKSRVCHFVGKDALKSVPFVV
jgi:hypothetical protein